MNRGFTLLELMVAIAVFAVLGLMSSQLLNNMIRQHDIIGSRGEQLIALQRGMTIMQRDITQMWGRGVRDAYGEDQLLPFEPGGDWPVEFTRTGWRNPLEHERSTLQRVAYEHRETTLYRYYWSVLDRSIDTEPVEQVLMEDVLSVEFEALDGNEDSFPQPGYAPGANTDPLLNLTAVRVRLDLEGYGELTRIWEVPENLFTAFTTGVTAGGPGGAGGENVPGEQSDGNNAANGATGGGRSDEETDSRGRNRAINRDIDARTARPDGN